MRASNVNTENECEKRDPSEKLKKSDDGSRIRNSKRAHSQTHTHIHIYMCPVYQSFDHFLTLRLNARCCCKNRMYTQRYVSLSMSVTRDVQWTVSTYQATHKNTKIKHVAHCSFMILPSLYLLRTLSSSVCVVVVVVVAAAFFSNARICGPPIPIHHGTEICHTKKLITFQCKCVWVCLSVSAHFLNLCVQRSRLHILFTMLAFCRSFSMDACNDCVWSMNPYAH